MTSIRSAGPALLILLCSVSRSSQAHLPVVAEPGLEIEQSTISHAIYGAIEAPDDVHIVRLSFDEAFALPFEILVPRRARLAEHRPAFALIGPGLPAPTPEQAAILPHPVAPGAGVFLELNDLADRPVIFESFTSRVFWSSTPVALALAPGAFEIWIFSPTGSTGDFVLGFGVEEDFSEFGCASLLSNWSSYAY